MSAQTPALRRPSLPLLLAPIVGREREQAELLDLLRTPAVRLITLTGPGGVGKTRLAVEVVRAAAPEFPDGISYVALDPIRDVALVLPTVAKTLGLTVTGHDTVLNELTVFVGDRQILLVLDNFEQVEDAGSEVAALLAACSELRVLATSRIPLQVYGEREYPIAPLPLPGDKEDDDTEDVTAFAAVRLFVDRAKEVRPNFALSADTAPAVAEICRRLDGLPLAIELAAARIKVLSPEALLDRLTNRLQVLTSGPRNLPTRLQTMRDAIAWSHDLLTPDERTLFRRLAAFSGGFTLEAAEAVAGSRELDGGTTPDSRLPSRVSPVSVLDGIADLVDESLVRQMDEDEGGTRFGMFQTILEFATEQLTESGEEDAVRRAHAVFFVDLAERASPELTGSDQNDWLDRLETEHDNLRAALSWAIAGGEISLAQRIAGALWRFWWVRCHFSEAQRWFDRVLALGDGTPTPERTLSLFGAGAMAEHLGDYDLAPAWYRKALDAARAIGDRLQIAESYEALALIEQDKGNYEEALKLHEQALALFRELGHRRGLAKTIHNLGSISYYRGDVADAEAKYTETLELVREMQDHRAAALILGNLGVLAAARSDFARAKQMQEATLELTRAGRDDLATGIALTNLGDVEMRLGDLDRATELNTEALELFEKMGTERGIASAHGSLGKIAHARGDSALAVEHLTVGLKTAHASQDAVATAGILDALAVQAGVLGDPRLGARLMGAAETLLSSIGSARSGPEAADHESNLAALRTAAGADDFDVAWAEGAATSLDEIVELAGSVSSMVAAPSPDSPAEDEAAGKLGLTRREVEVLRLFVAGRSNAEIAETLAVSLPTATTYIGNLYTKLGVDSRAGVTATAFKHGLV